MWVSTPSFGSTRLVLSLLAAAAKGALVRINLVHLYSMLTVLGLVLNALTVKVTQSCPTLCNTMYYTVHRILQARILDWVAVPFSRGSSQPRDRNQVSLNAGGFFTSWTTREALSLSSLLMILPQRGEGSVSSCLSTACAVHESNLPKSVSSFWGHTI